MLVGVDDLLTSTGTHRDRHDLLREDAVVLRCHRPRVRVESQFVLLRAGDRVLGAQVLGGLDHAAGHRVEAAAGGGAGTDQAVVHLHPRAGAAPADIGGVERGIAHRLGAPGDDHVVVSVAHLQRGLDHGLQARPATAIDVHAGDGDGQARVECDDPADRGSLAVAVAVTEDDVPDLVGSDTRAVEQTLQCRDAEIDGGEGLEHSAVPADRGPDRFADDNFAHDGLSEGVTR